MNVISPPHPTPLHPIHAHRNIVCGTVITQSGKTCCRMVRPGRYQHRQQNKGLHQPTDIDNLPDYPSNKFRVESGREFQATPRLVAEVAVEILRFLMVSSNTFTFSTSQRKHPPVEGNSTYSYILNIPGILYSWLKGG